MEEGRDKESTAMYECNGLLFYKGFLSYS